MLVYIDFKKRNEFAYRAFMAPINFNYSNFIIHWVILLFVLGGGLFSALMLYMIIYRQS